jgi:hypothetical protein
MVQQRRELGLGGLSGRRVHPRDVGRRGSPALRPDLGLDARDPPRLVPSLSASRFLRRLHRYYDPVRLPTSARVMAPTVPRLHPPPETNPAEPGLALGWGHQEDDSHPDRDALFAHINTQVAAASSSQ